jgi:rhodanese-related sulfurtransferase
VTQLRRRGYDAHALVGGITAWHAIGGETVSMDTSIYARAP